MIGSGAFEIHFSLPGETRLLKQPFYFHHTPKAAGTSLRQSVREWLERSGQRGSVVVPRIESRLKHSGHWPDELFSFYESMKRDLVVDVVMSHYAALLSDRIEGPIVALVRDPEDHFYSSLAFFSIRLAKVRERRSDLRWFLSRPRINNAQISSLSGRPVPPFAPASAEEKKPWLELVEHVVSRFTLFRVKDYSRLLDHCLSAYGMDVHEIRRKTGKPDAQADALAEIVEEFPPGQDPVWLDRILYDRVGNI